jgi:hypothetical protein
MKFFTAAVLFCSAIASPSSALDRTMGWYATQDDNIKTAYAGAAIAMVHAQSPETRAISDIDLKECLDETAKGKETWNLSVSTAAALCIKIMVDSARH